MADRQFPLFSPALAMLLTGIGLCFFIGPGGNFPLNDDWQYAYPVKSLVEEGVLRLNGAFAPNLLLQVFWGYLFCLPAGEFSFSWLRWSTLAAAAIGLIFFYRLVASSCSNNRGFWAAWCLMLNPLFFSLSFTFMTDVPFLTLCLIAGYFFYRHIEVTSGLSLAIALLAAVAAFLIRQPGIVLLPAWAFFLLWDQPTNRRNILKALGWVVLAAGIYLAYENGIKPMLRLQDHYVPVAGLFWDQWKRNPLLFGLELVKKLLKTFIYLGFFCLPFLPLLWPLIRRSHVLKWKTFAPTLLLNFGLLAYLHGIQKIFPFGGNILFNFGLGPELLADVYTLGLPNTRQLPLWSMYAIQFTSQLSISLLLILGYKTRRTLARNQRRFLAFLLLVNALYLPAMSITSFFDRYLLLPVASAFWFCSLLLPSGHPSYVLRRSFLLLAIALFSILGTMDYINWNKARAQAFLFLQKKGIGIQETDAGYEYNGWYNYHPGRIEKEGRSFWWVTDDRFLITFGQVEGYVPLKSFPYFRWLAGKRENIWILKRIKEGQRNPDTRGAF